MAFTPYRHKKTTSKGGYKIWNIKKPLIGGNFFKILNQSSRSTLTPVTTLCLVPPRLLTSAKRI
ncbi:TPA: hypothetical protein ACIFCT_003716, partial [Acinetobacter baumannii]